jgi:hypothetical protein
MLYPAAFHSYQERKAEEGHRQTSHKPMARNFLKYWKELWGSQDSVLGIAIRYELEGPEFEAGGGDICRTPSGRPRGPFTLL